MDNPFEMVRERPCRDRVCYCALCTADNAGMLQTVVREIVIAYAKKMYPEAPAEVIIAAVDQLEPRASWEIRMEETLCSS